MSQFIVYKCDRCGAEERIVPVANTGYYKQETMRADGSHPKQIYYICPKCYLAYTTWLNSPENDISHMEESEA